MADSAFSDATWRPGEPLDPNQPKMPSQELSDRLLFLERAVDNLRVGDLPLAGLMKTLEQEWLPDPSTLFAAGAITSESLPYTDYYGQVSAAGAIVLGGSGKWTVVRNGAGDYTITFPAYRTMPIAAVLPALSVTGLRASVKTLSTVRIVMSADSDFDFIIRGK